MITLILIGFKAHGDPHAGNILVGEHPTPKFSWLSILDWGNTVEISPEVQIRLYNAAIGIATKNTDKVARALMENADDINNNELFRKFCSEIRSTFKLASEIQTARNGKKTTLSVRKHDSNSMSFDSDKNISPVKKFLAKFKKTELDEETRFFDAMEYEDNVSLSSPFTQEKILELKEWSHAQQILDTLDSIFNLAMKLNIPIPKGTASVFRARMFLEQTLSEIAAHPSFAISQCKQKSSVEVFVAGLMTVDGSLKAMKKFLKHTKQ